MSIILLTIAYFLISYANNYNQPNLYWAAAFLIIPIAYSVLLDAAMILRLMGKK